MDRTDSGRAASRTTSAGRVVTIAVAMSAVFAVFVAPSAVSAATTPKTASVIATAKSSKFGTVLVAKTTVYTLQPSSTACKTACLKVWPPVLLPSGTKKATAGKGVRSSKLGTAAAAHGARQVTYGGKRLYWFAKDTAPGQVKGNVDDKWGTWSSVATARSASSSKSPGTTSAGTGGSGF